MTYRQAAAAAVFSLIALAAHGAAVSYQINPQHTGSAVFANGLKLPLQQIWTVNQGGLVTYPLIAEGKVFYSSANSNGGYGSVYYALDATTGQTVWSQSIPGPYFASFGAYDRGCVYVLNFAGLLQAFAASNGALRWQVQLTGQYSFAAPPTASGGVIYINGAGSAATVYAVSEVNGLVLWSQHVNGSEWGAPTLSEDGVFVSYPCQAYELDMVTGAIRWNFNGGCDGGGGVTTALYDQTLFTSYLLEKDLDSGNALLAYNGKRLGKLGNLENANAYETGIGFSYPPALQAGMGYFVTNAGTLNAVSVPGLASQWQFSSNNTFAPAPIVVNGHVIVASTQGELYVLDGSNGTVQQTLDLPASASSDDGGVPPGLAASDGLIVVPYLMGITAFRGAR